jgi:hypothetical protein
MPYCLNDKNGNYGSKNTLQEHGIGINTRKNGKKRQLPYTVLVLKVKFF